MMRFEPGDIVSTPGAMKLMAVSEVGPFDLLARHLSGDWGDVPAEDAKENDFSVENGYRIMSSYPVGGDRIWIITESDRSVTTFLLPSEY